MDNTEENMRLAREDTQKRLKITRMYEVKNKIINFSPLGDKIRLRKLFREYFQLSFTNNNNDYYRAIFETINLANRKVEAEIVLDIIKPKFFEFCIKKNLINKKKDFTLEDIKDLTKSEDRECRRLAEIITGTLIKLYGYEEAIEKTYPTRKIPFFEGFNFEEDLLENYPDINLELENLLQNKEQQSFSFAIKSFGKNSEKRQKE